MEAELIVESFDSLEDAHDECAFEWAESWDIAKLGKPSIVWRKEGTGITGLPGFAEVPEKFARLFAAAPDLLAACYESRKCIPDGHPTLAVLDSAIRKATEPTP